VQGKDDINCRLDCVNYFSDIPHRSPDAEKPAYILTYILLRGIRGLGVRNSAILRSKALRSRFAGRCAVFRMEKITKPGSGRIQTPSQDRSGI
jgi:hypothetical protein